MCNEIHIRCFNEYQAVRWGGASRRNDAGLVSALGMKTDAARCATSTLFMRPVFRAAGERIPGTI
jgi:hypothetical protein